MKKILLWTLLLWFLFSFSYGAVLSLSPSEWKLAENCVQEFNVILRMNEWEKALAMDLLVKSNMEFIDFENGSLFKYAVPPREYEDAMYFWLFNWRGLETTEWWLVWKLFYSTANVEEPYIEFVFDWLWETTDTNLSIWWKDILEDTLPGRYTISADMDCDTPVVIKMNSSDDDMEAFIENYQKDHKSEKFLIFWNTNRWYILWIMWLLIIIIVLVSYKAQKKW